MPFVLDRECVQCGTTFKADKYAQPREDTCPGCRVPDLHVTLPHFFAAIGELVTTTYYTVVEEPIKQYWPFYCLVSLPSARQCGKRPSMYGYFADPGEASQETRACYGQDIEYLSIEQFRNLHP